MPRVLVIDDESDVRTMIGIVLRIHHFEVVEAGSAAAGTKAFEAARFDLAIIDVFLQGSNGVDLIVQMREQDPDLPIVAISGMTTLDFVTSPRDCPTWSACRSRSAQMTCSARSMRSVRGMPPVARP